MAGALILSKLRLAERAGKKGEFALGSLGGFDLRGDIGRGFYREVEASLVLLRTDYDQEIRTEADLTQIGLIARLERILEHFEADLREQERRAQDAADRLTGYEQRLGQPYALRAELDAKLAQLEALEADLAQTGKEQTGTADAGKLAA